MSHVIAAEQRLKALEEEIAQIRVFLKCDTTQPPKEMLLRLVSPRGGGVTQKGDVIMFFRDGFDKPPTTTFLSIPGGVLTSGCIYRVED